MRIWTVRISFYFVHIIMHFNASFPFDKCLCKIIKKIPYCAFLLYRSFFTLVFLYLKAVNFQNIHLLIYSGRKCNITLKFVKYLGCETSPTVKLDMGSTFFKRYTVYFFEKLLLYIEISQIILLSCLNCD